jgi:hypothetical protein
MIPHVRTRAHRRDLRNLTVQNVISKTAKKAEDVRVSLPSYLTREPGHQGGRAFRLSDLDRYNPNELLITDCYASGQSRIASPSYRENTETRRTLGGFLRYAPAHMRACSNSGMTSAPHAHKPGR